MRVIARALTVVVALALGGGSAVALAACGADDAGRIAPGDAEEITQALDAARQAYAGGACDEAQDLTQQAREAAVGLPSSVDSELRSRINDGFRALDDELVPDCEAEVSTETLPETTPTIETTPTETVPTETTPTETTPTETVPPETQTVPPPVEPVPPTEEPPVEPADPGGVNPEDFE